MRRREVLGAAVSAPAAALAGRAAQMASAPAAQLRRRVEIYKLHQAACGRLFSDAGEWVGPPTENTPRVRLWHSVSLLSSPDTRDKGNAVIRRAFADRAGLSAFSHFEFCAAAQILAKSRQALAPASEELLAGLLREHLTRPGNIRWMGYNDNFPAMENVAQCLGGDLLSDSAARQRGMDGLAGLLEYFGRRGFLAEYTSPTYTPITLLCFADIAEYARP